jgi:putative Mg2+ transporter-C (MgtC) family protein
MLVCVGIWTVAAVGLAVGGGLYLAASTSTVIILIILAPRTSRQNRPSARRQPRR